ncbi:hypothetical protein V565_265070 [Rhizoctonia solani 123E]|uniref:Uncharacterized protein n=1 Tax=Rhizoctonia solani 123E TaxID=1423351 RepID=A0A074REE5_9AGAM|nr:hypothetical protein V565_265070 [Rhizoctonia solani 123E]
MFKAHGRKIAQKVPSLRYYSAMVLPKAKQYALETVRPLARHQTQPPYNHKAQGTPLSPIKVSAKAITDISPTNKLLSSILSWLDQDAPHPLRLQPVDFVVFENVLDQLYDLGVKPRYDWDTMSRSVTLRIPSEFREAPGAWFIQDGSPFINKKLSEIALRGHPSMISLGSTPLVVGDPMGDEEKGMMPDQSLYLIQIDADGGELKVQDAPLLIFETSAGESRRHIIEKVFDYLFEMIGVQTAVICDLTNVPPRAQSTTSDATSAKAFKAEIAVWSRKATGLVDLDPLDPCYHREELGGHKLGRVITDSWDPTSYLESKASPAVVCHLVPGQKFDSCAREYSRPNPNNPAEEQRIYRRSPDWIVLCDESTLTGPEEPQPLIFDAYDFLRPCSQHPNSYIPDRSISVPLGVLRKRLMMLLRRRRNPVLQAPMPKAASTARRVHPNQRFQA